MLPAQCANLMALVASRSGFKASLDRPSSARFEPFHHWLQLEPETGSFMLQSAGQTIDFACENWGERNGE